MDRETTRRITTMLDAIERIHRLIGRMSVGELAGDPDRCWAVERGFEII